jgi:hypothetical protein
LSDIFLNDLGITIELVGFVILIIRGISIGQKLRKRDNTKRIYDALLPLGFIVVIIGLILQYGFFQQFNLV